jgi:hypothetical protein
LEIAVVTSGVFTDGTAGAGNSLAALEIRAA